MAIIKLNNQSISAVSALPAGITTGKVLQVVSATGNSQVTFTTAGALVYSGIEVAITPSSTSNKIYAIIHGNGINSGSSGRATIVLARHTSSGGTSGSQLASFNLATNDVSGIGDLKGSSISYLDSPNTTSTRYYKILAYNQDDSSTSYLSFYAEDYLNITVMEIAG